MQYIYLQSKEALDETGTVLLRGLNLDQLTFEYFTKYFCQDFFRVTSREKFRLESGDGFTTLTPTDNITILGHVEVDYVPGIKTPNIGFFFCETPPEVEGGETFLVEGVAMFNTLSKSLQERFKNEQVTYEFLWEPQRWEAQYGVNTKEELCKRLDRIENVRYELKNDWLHLFYTTSAIINFNDGTTAFSNAILGHLPELDHPSYHDKTVYRKETNRVYWENGEAFSIEVVNELIDAHDQHKQHYRWQKGDLLIFDNYRYLHGKEETIEWTERRLFSRFGYLDIDIE
ncbi:TauD/TfdA family dioxygenase [Sulfurovum sp. zt1-1]|uniref:TauD/TfdA family dioxygenase n=2 Tax=Sulfurovum zhangzhouensis TaxID=3019067 RepID=A0ABT7QYL7_9BACT|nr:TauD/TfdA family dioxygenase [Sulfurovum zhangzhouensis]